MPTVVVSGSNNDFQFAVTDFSNTPPTTVYVNPGFGAPGGPTNNGCVVACSSLFTQGDVSSSLVAVGHFGGSEVAIYDLSDPASPQLQTIFYTGLASIGALSLWGNNLLVGEYNGPSNNIALLDISKPQSSALVSTRPLTAGGGGITSIALSGDNGLLAVVAGASGAAVLDYTNPANPVINSIDLPLPPPAVQSNLPYVCDFDGSTAALGDANGNVFVFNIQSGVPSLIGQSWSVLEGITSIAVQGPGQVAAGFFGDPEVALLTFGGPQPPPVMLVMVGGGPGPNPGGAVAFYGLPNLFASTNNGRGITWLNTAVWPNTGLLTPPSPVGVAANANLNPATVSTLGIAYFPTPRWPRPFSPSWFRALWALIARLFG